MSGSQRGALVVLLALAPLGGLAAQAATLRPLSLEEALNLAVPASEGLELAKAAVVRARGEEYRAGSILDGWRTAVVTRLRRLFRARRAAAAATPVPPVEA